ncbi:MAG: hypothetical protein HY908_00530 [Myxococcales bacterium]|nr:hypothetical protein [Myxococcales bacterium]
MLHLRATEVMSGQHHFVDPALGAAGDQACYFRLTWGGPATEILKPLRRAPMRYAAEGIIYFAGLTADDTPCRGTISIDYARDHKIVYELDLEVAGASYRFHGEKVDVRPWRPLELAKTHTTCYGTLCAADGRIVSRSVVHFLPASLPAFVRSFRLTLGAAASSSA